MMFNGTCGIWRREAIEQAGGWSGRSLAEDQDLSYRAYAAGWRSRCVLSVSAAGELPESLTVLVGQRQRWSTGTAQTLRKLPWDMINGLAWHQAAAFVVLALFSATSSLALMSIAALVALAGALEPMSVDIVVISALMPIALIVLAKSTGAILATLILGRRLGVGFVLDVARMWLLQLVLLPVGGLSFLVGVVAQDRPFTRTPKRSD
jgi:cellulose synthase/poly-beta-1,6-N-acetylglucosamine synthase-like glycosyltransferase